MTVKEFLFKLLNEIAEKMNYGKIEVDNPNDLTYMDYWNGFKALTDLAYAAALYDGEYEIASDMLSAVNELVKVKRIFELSDKLGIDRIELDDNDNDKNSFKLNLN